MTNTNGFQSGTLSNSRAGGEKFGERRYIDYDVIMTSEFKVKS